MKKIFLTTLLFGMIACGANSQIPAEVQDAFKRKYKNVQDEDWVSSEKEYQVTFIHEELEKEAFFDVQGNWLRTQTLLNVDELPICITDNLYDNYGEFYILEAQFFESPQVEKFIIDIEIEPQELDIEDEDEQSDSENIRVAFDNDCNPLDE